jgi:hypothetical protein
VGVDPTTGSGRAAKGIIAVGGVATGVVALGRRACGGICIGPLAVGLLGFGPLTVGLVGFGGLSLSLALGVGWFALAPAASGLVAGGYLANGFWVWGVHTSGLFGSDPLVERFLGWTNGWVGELPLLLTLLVPLLIGGSFRLLQRAPNSSESDRPVRVS